MLRFFSNFASGWPAFGLLLMRLAEGSSLIADGAMRLHRGESVLAMTVDLLAIGAGALLVVGLWTPIAGTVAVAVSIREIIRYESPYPGILLVAMGAGLALVGPGAFSIDARIFGLKKIDIEKLK